MPNEILSAWNVCFRVPAELPWVVTNCSPKLLSLLHIWSSWLVKGIGFLKIVLFPGAVSSESSNTIGIYGEQGNRRKEAFQKLSNAQTEEEEWTWVPLLIMFLHIGSAQSMCAPLLVWALVFFLNAWRRLESSKLQYWDLLSKAEMQGTPDLWECSP